MRRAAIAVVLVLVAASSFAAEKWWDPYKRGTLAAQTSDWNTVATEMNRAIALKPVEELAAKARSEIIVYVPHFWLGIAKYHLGDADGALNEWQVSQQQNVIQKTQYYADLRAWISRAQSAKVKKAGESSAKSRAAADEALTRALGGQVEAVTAGADRTDSFRAAKRKFDEAYETYNKAGNDDKLLKQAAASFAEAREMFVASAKDAQAKKAAAKQAPRPQPAVQKPAVVTQQPVQKQPPPTTQTQAQIAPPVAKPEPVKVVETKPEPPVESEEAVNARVDLQQLRRRALDAKRADGRLDEAVSQVLVRADAMDQQLKSPVDDAKLDEIKDSIASIDGDLTRRVAALKAEDQKKAREVAEALEKAGPMAKEAVKKQIRTAYVSYAKGDLASSEAVLDAIVATKTKSAEAYLLRGAARYTRAAMSRQRELLAQAEADFAAALKLNPSAGLDPNYFSPKLISFFHDVRKKQAGVR